MRSPTDMRKWCPQLGQILPLRSSWRLNTWASQAGHLAQASDGAARRLKGNLIGNAGSDYRCRSRCAGPAARRLVRHTA
jgi:hypothetical protein